MTPSEHSTYLLVKCHDPKDANAVVADLQEEFKHRNDMSVFTTGKFSIRSRLHWLTKTRGGIALGYTALLGLLVGAVVTAQTLYAATVASAKEFAILLAMGIPRIRITITVIVQSFWVGLIGTLVSYPVVWLLAKAGRLIEMTIPLPLELLGVTGVITMVMAMIAGIVALRSVRQIEPMQLLR
jgi:putative ABC transport system permease protein